MKISFEYFRIQKRMLQTVRSEKVDEKNGVINLVFIFPRLWSLNYLKKYIFCNFLLTSARNLGLLKQFTYMCLEGLVTDFRKMYCLLCYDLLFLRY